MLIKLCIFLDIITNLSEDWFLSKNFLMVEGLNSVGGEIIIAHEFESNFE